MPIIEVDNVSKSYPARQGARALLGRGGIASWFGAGATPYEALRGINLSIDAGHSLGIIGRNGSGKSTLLKMLAGVTLPTSGRITVCGRVASLLELGAGFHPMLTGRENVYLNAGLLGMRHNEVNQVFDSIVAFSGIAPFIDQPVDTYSSGMYVRIAFAVAVHVNPDIFLVDEVLSVGDEEFQRKCRRKIGELKEQGKTIVFVSHDLGSVAALCDRVVLLSEGRMICRETPQQTIEYYLRQVGQAGGIHTLRAQDTEVLFNHGALSVFTGGCEVTASMGLRLQLHSQGHVQDSHDAVWTVTSPEEIGCEAKCELPRLPITLKYTLALRGTRLHWQIRMNCNEATHIDRFVVLIPAPECYDQWTYDGERGSFPDITPSDLAHTVIVPPAPASLEACLLPADHAAVMPALRIAMNAPGPGWTIHLANSDYATGARVVTLHRQVPRSDQPIPAGEHDLLAVDIDLVDVTRALASHERALAARTLRAGTVTAQVGRGDIALLYAGQPLTKGLHLHTQMYLSNVWVMSQALRWSTPVPAHSRIQATGDSPRFPLRQHWEVERLDSGIGLVVWLEVQAQMALDEYNISIALNPDFSHWRTAHEEGDFPDFPPDDTGWQHLNHSYAPGDWIEASGAGLARVRLEVSGEPGAFRCSALNSGRSQEARIIQAIRLPERAGVIELAAGRHELLRAKITLLPPDGPDA